MSDRTIQRVDRAPVDEDRKAQDRQLWASGSYARVAELVAPMGPDLISVAGVGEGMQVLDVAAGTGNAAIPAAQTGATVTAADLTPELLTAGRARADELGVQLDWVEADAEDLPFPAASFDVVLSCIGAMFAPDHARTAAELVRVCRPGGTIALANWTPHGYGGSFFRLLGGYAPPPPAGTVPPTAWGEPDHVQKLFDGQVEGLSCSPRAVTLAFTGSPEELCAVYQTSFGPVLATRAAIADDPARLAALDRELLEFLRSENVGAGESPGRGRYEFEYLAVTATRR
jgi:2-polyprenyl-6-hydroxyphenyl methylase/3-demethylubiquinone-9 3-methyltransferase